jgi:hypothetical protein
MNAAMIVLSEASPRLSPSASLRDITAATEAARLVGCRVFAVPQEEEGLTADDALAHVPAQADETPGFWIGYIPSAERYAAIYEALRSRGIRLPNTLEEHQRAQEFDRAYPHLAGMTPESLTITELSECEAAVSTLGLPLFVKGAVQSRKARGWRACVAESADELRTLAAHLLELENRSRGRVIVRRLVRLRHARITPGGFPLGREYRVFVYNSFVVALGYYWEGDDPLRALSPAEETTVRALAVEAARRLRTPYIAVDIGQTEAGDWIVIETGDAQFSGLSQIPPLALWSRLRQLMDGENGGQD